MGQHNEQVLTQTLGYSAERVAELLTRCGVLRRAALTANPRALDIVFLHEASSRRYRLFE
jgi:hypothetical protein